MSVISPLMTVMIAAARKAGKAITRDFGEVENLKLPKKGPLILLRRRTLKPKMLSLKN